MIRIVTVITFLLFFYANAQKNSGYIIYKASLTEAYNYSDDFKLTYPDAYRDELTKDSIINSIEIGVVFDKLKSKSFNTKPFTISTNPYYTALYKINFDADYFYDNKVKISTISRDFWSKKVLITLELKDKWEIDLNKTKMIDGYKCYFARYKGQYMWSPSSSERVTSAWFTTDIPIPYGPLHYNGLPGLIIELNDNNVRFTATKISFDNKHLSKLKPIDFSGKDKYTEQEFINKREDIRRTAKRIMTGG